MRRALSTALAGCFLLTMTMAQSCSTSATYGASTFSGGTAPNTPNTAYNGSGSASASNYASSASSPTTATHIDTAGYTADQSNSENLSNYLKHHRLPLVGAQVLKNPEGQKAVVLYGFVGSDFGKQDAADKAHSYLADANIPIDNRITVRPELLTAGRNNGTSAGSQEAESGGSGGYADENSAGSQYPGVSSYEQQSQQGQQANQAQQYAQQQSTGSAISSAMPLVMLGLMALSMTSGGAFSVGPGSFGSSQFGSSSFGSPFGSFGGSSYGAPYNPYPGFPSPSPYGGSSVTPFGGAGSPYTATPPSSSPYGP